MKRSVIACMLALPLIALLGSPLAAEVKTREKTLVKLEGMLGRVVGLFGGKAAREGIVSTSAVKGDRKSTMSDNTGQIVDLGEEKIYEVDLKKREYRVTTFEELRRRMREAQEKAKKDMEREQGDKKEEETKPDEPRKEWEVDFDVKETGQRKQLVGHDTRQVIMTVTLREKGKTLEDGGGFVMASDTWLGPEIAALRELSDFEMRYYKQLHGTESFGLPADQMAMVMGMYPMVKQASERIAQEGDKLKGTPLATTTTFEIVQSKEQVAEAAKQEKSGGGGGIGGMLARRMMKKEEPKARVTVFTAQHEFQDVSTAVAGTDLEIPAGFKEKK
jgi:hypothetical protein